MEKMKKMNTTFKINEALGKALDDRRKINMQELAAKLFPECTTDIQRSTNLRNLKVGRLKRIKPEWVGIICDTCGVTPEFLFNYKKKEEN